MRPFRGRCQRPCAAVRGRDGARGAKRSRSGSPSGARGGRNDADRGARSPHILPRRPPVGPPRRPGSAPLLGAARPRPVARRRVGLGRGEAGDRDRDCPAGGHGRCRGLRRRAVPRSVRVVDPAVRGPGARSRAESARAGARGGGSARARPGREARGEGAAPVGAASRGVAVRSCRGRRWCRWQAPACGATRASCCVYSSGDGRRSQRKARRSGSW